MRSRLGTVCPALLISQKAMFRSFSCCVRCCRSRLAISDSETAAALVARVVFLGRVSAEMRGLLLPAEPALPTDLAFAVANFLFCLSLSFASLYNALTSWGFLIECQPWTPFFLAI